MAPFLQIVQVLIFKLKRDPVKAYFNIITKKSFKFLILSFLIHFPAWANSGILDVSFGTDGFAESQVGNAGVQDTAAAIAQTSDGKIIVAGTSYEFGGTNGNIIEIARFSAEGIEETSGMISLTDQAGTSVGAINVFDMVVDSQDRIVIAGTVYRTVYKATGQKDHDNGNILVARLIFDRSSQNYIPDVSFGGLGYLEKDFFTYNDVPYSLSLDQNDNIIVGGFSEFRNASWEAFGFLAKISNAGIFDESFGQIVTNASVESATHGQSVSGIALVDLDPYTANYQIGYKVKFLNNYGIYVFGDTGNYTTMAVARFDFNGQLDASYGDNGIGLSPIINDWGVAVTTGTIDSQGRAYISGYTYDYDLSYFSIVTARLNTDGTVDDRDFGGRSGGGFVSSDFRSQYAEWNWPYPTSISVDTDGKIYVTGWVELGLGNGFFMVAYNGDGSTDNGFGMDGLVANFTIDPETYSEAIDWTPYDPLDGESSDAMLYSVGILFQSGGKIITGGSINHLNSSSGDTLFGTARFGSDVPPDDGECVPGSTVDAGNQDTDGDGVNDCQDECPEDPAKTTAGQCGCGITDTDADGDGTANCNDQCPVDGAKTIPGLCGCNEVDSSADADGDGIVDCQDQCIAQAEVCDGLDNDCDGLVDDGLTRACSTICGSGTELCTDGAWGGCNAPQPQLDLCDGIDNDCNGIVDDGYDGDGDGVTTCGGDTCANDSTKTSPGACGCGVADTDDDGDGTADCVDNCPADSQKVNPGICGCGNVDSSADADGDGIPDCVDVCVAQAEVCDGIDNDCDGIADEGFDQDGDSLTSCAGDCDDTSAAVHPRLQEICDGIDNDCDRTLDEGCDCIHGETRACGTSDGACQQGTQTCFNGEWQSECVDEVGPAAEVCDGVDNDCDNQTDEGTDQTCSTQCGDGVAACSSAGQLLACDAPVPSAEVCDALGMDEDCDGDINEGCACTDGQTRPCGSDEGECQVGTQTCENGQWEECTGALGPSTEVCDNLDNDCDGTADSFERECSTACGSGNQMCIRGSWQSCNAPAPSAEVCDLGNLDEDCDGEANEGCDCVDGETRACGLSAGACVEGIQSCVDGQWSDDCSGEISATEEVCDGIDNNCDGQTDEGLTETCSTECGEGVRVCSNGQFGTCSAPMPASEECDEIDNDCDGQVDEDCDCRAGESRSCGTDTGVCATGVQNCQNGQWSDECTGEAGPSEEICDGVDNDCNGFTNEDLSQDCYSGPQGTLNVGMCRGGTQTCGLAAWGECVGEVTPGTEACNGLDDDCDGSTDENCDCLDGETRSCGSNIGDCQEGSQICTDGYWSETCDGETGAETEVCDDGRDNDCDGAIDQADSTDCTPPSSAPFSPAAVPSEPTDEEPNNPQPASSSSVSWDLLGGACSLQVSNSTFPFSTILILLGLWLMPSLGYGFIRKKK